MSSSSLGSSNAIEAPKPPEEGDLPPMVEVDLLPRWYPVLLRRRRRLMLQAWATGVLVVILVGVLVWRRANEEASQVELASLVEQRRMTDAQLSELVVEEAGLDGLIRRAQLVSRMGLPLEVSRVLGMVDAAMSEDISLTTLDVRLEEQRLPGRNSQHATVRRMRFTLVGYTENSKNATDFSSRLQGQPLLREVKVGTVRATAILDRPVVLFEMTFHVDLAPGGGAFSEVRAAS